MNKIVHTKCLSVLSYYNQLFAHFKLSMFSIAGYFEIEFYITHHTICKIKYSIFVNITIIITKKYLMIFTFKHPEQARLLFVSSILNYYFL